MKRKVFLSVCAGIAGIIITMTVFPFAADADNNDPSVDLAAAPMDINTGEHAVLVWGSSNADICTASGGWSGIKSKSGSEITAPLSHTTYSIMCTNNGKIASDSITIQVHAQPPVTETFHAACAVSSPTVAVGNTVTFVAGQAGGMSPLTFIWSGDVSGASQTRTISFGTTGTKFATVTVTDGQGRTNSANCSVQAIPATIVESPPPPPTIVTAAANPKTTCSCGGTGVDEKGNIIEVADANKNKSILASILTADNGGPSLLLYLLLFFLVILVIIAMVRYHMLLDRRAPLLNRSAYPPHYQNSYTHPVIQQYPEYSEENAPIDESIFEPKRTYAGVNGKNSYSDRI